MRCMRCILQPQWPSLIRSSVCSGLDVRRPRQTLLLICACKMARSGSVPTDVPPAGELAWLATNQAAAALLGQITAQGNLRAAASSTCAAASTSCAPTYTVSELLRAEHKFTSSPGPRRGLRLAAYIRHPQHRCRTYMLGRVAPDRAVWPALAAQYIPRPVTQEKPCHTQSAAQLPACIVCLVRSQQARLLKWLCQCSSGRSW